MSSVDPRSLSSSVPSSPSRTAAVSSELALQPGARRLQLTAPWLEVHGWTATGRDGAGRPVRGMGRAREASLLGGPVAPPVVMLPVGFQGGLSLLDRRQDCLGRVAIDRFGLPEFSARSADLDVRVEGKDEIVVDRRSAELRCYVSLPTDIGAREMLIKAEDGSVTRLPVTTPRGLSFPLPARFRGTVQLLDGTGRVQFRADIRNLGTRNGSDIVTTMGVPGYEARVRATGAMLEIALQPAGRLRSGIR